MKVVAIMIVRNEEACLPRCLEHLSEQGLTVAVVDNDSTDRTRAILEASGVVERIDHAPFDGTFRLGELLKRAHLMRDTLTADWLHLNSPDEIFNSNRPGERLVDAIARADAEGFTAINYDEFVFLPTDEKTRAEGKAFDRLLRHYYFYQPLRLNLVRSCKNIPGISNLRSGGHVITGPGIRVYPENLPLRHYIGLSADHFRSKYRNRIYPAEELARGWHYDRATIDTERVRMPSARLLKYFAGDDVRGLDRSEVWLRHFWETPRPLVVNLPRAPASSERAPAASSPGAASLAIIGRNAPCPCGSGLKYKNCHGPTVRDLHLRKKNRA
ncbi:MAG TPA: SEC-C metal-binding domain-containing protein [Bauldia sp.]|nr:SEC-C metal-binding domain-containing protein [Bauldia sp.]